MTQTTDSSAGGNVSITTVGLSVQRPSSQVFSDQDDVVTGGSPDLVTVTEDTTESGILSESISTLAGDDLVTGTARLQLGETAAEDTELNSFGIQQSTIDLGIGNDTVTALGESVGTDEPTSSNRLEKGTLTSYGLSRSLVNGRGGNDTLSFTGITRARKRGQSFGLSAATVGGGIGNDTISITATDSSTFSSEESKATGAEDSSVRGHSGDDNIAVSVTASASQLGSSTAAIGLDRTLMSGDRGNDNIQISVEGQFGSQSRAVGLSASQLFGGTGDDLIEISTRAIGADPAGPTGSSTGVGLGSTVFSGAGNDRIKIEASSVASGRGGSAISYASRNASILGGGGDDSIELKGTSNGLGSMTAYGALDTKINGGWGRDTISFVAEASGSADIFALAQSRVAGGDGDDIITANTQALEGAGGPGTFFPGSGGYGIFESRVNGGRGNDRITSSSGEAGIFDIQDTLLFGGTGNDFFDVGVGSGTVYGGVGRDTIVIDFFDAETMQLSAINGGLRISGTQNKLGNEAAWTQDILGVEQFQLGDSTFSTEEVTALFA